MVTFIPPFETLLECADGATPEVRAAAANALAAVLRRAVADAASLGTRLVFSDRLLDPKGGDPDLAMGYAFARSEGSVVYSGAGQSFQTEIKGGTLAERMRLRRIWDGAAPGSPFRQDPLFVSLVDSTDPPEGAATFGQFMTHAAGSYVVQFAGQVRSHGPNEPQDVIIGVAVDGVVVATTTVVRPTIEDDPVNFDTDDEVVLAAPGVITLINGGAYEQTAYGLLRIIPA